MLASSRTGNKGFSEGLPLQSAMRLLALGGRNAYLAAMSWFPRPAAPSAALRDLAAFLRQRSREQMIGAALALLTTVIVVILFTVDSKINTAPPTQIVYVESWNAGRTDAEIVAEQKKHQAERRAAEAEKRRQYQKLEKQFGIE